MYKIDRSGRRVQTSFIRTDPIGLIMVIRLIFGLLVMLGLILVYFSEALQWVNGLLRKKLTGKGKRAIVRKQRIQSLLVNH